MSEFSKRWPSSLTFPLVLLLIISGFYWKLTFTYQFDWLWGPDLAQQVLPWFEEESRQIHHSRAPLWDPHAWAGQPLLAQAQPGAAYPLNWILFLLPHQRGHIPMWALQWYYIVIHYMAALFCYLLCRDLGRSRAASLIGALIFSLAGYVGTTDWPQMLNGAVWTPLVFLFLLRAARGLRPAANTALGGLFLGIAWLSGHHQVPIYISLTAAGVWLYYTLRFGRIDWKVARLAVLFFVITVLVGALQILPAQEYGKLALRWVGTPEPLAWDQSVPYYIHQQFSLYPQALLAIVIPGLPSKADPFIGVVALALLMAGIALCWKHHAVKMFAAIAAAGLVYALGPHSVFQGFLYAVLPLLDKARVPAMAMLMFTFGAAVLASYGADHIESTNTPAWSRRIAAGAVVFALILMLVFMQVLFMKKVWDMDDRILMTALVALLLAALLYAWGVGSLTHRQAITLATLLLLLELGNDSSYLFADRSQADRRSYLDKTWGNDDLEQYLNQQPNRPFRIDMTTGMLALNWAEYHNFDAIKSFTAGTTADIMKTEWHTWNGRMLFGDRYSVADMPERPEQQEVFTGQSGVKIYNNPNAFPRAWAVHQVAPLKGPEDFGVQIAEHLPDLHSKAFVQDELPKIANCEGSGDSVTFERYEAERVELRADLACDGLVVLSDTYYPGWVAWVDNQPARIYHVNAAMRGVVVPRGSHLVTMRYRPKSVYIGAALTFLGVLGTLGLVFLGRKDASAH
jgi:hypothetical protein